MSITPLPRNAAYERIASNWTCKKNRKNAYAGEITLAVESYFDIELLQSRWPLTIKKGGGYSIPLVPLTEQQYLQPGREYEEVHGL